MSTPYYLSHKAKDIDSKLSEISNSLKVWKNNTPYNLGDVVISDYTDLTKGTTFTALLTCKEGHLSHTMGIPGVVDTDKWDIKQIVSGSSLKATSDILGDTIHTTYAKKSDLQDVTKNEILGYISYTTKDDYTIEITGCDTEITGNYVIPDDINGRPITSIGYEAFEGCKDLTGVILPRGLLNIADRAFTLCGKLSNVELSNNLLSVGDDVFQYTSVTSLVIPNKLTILPRLSQVTKLEKVTIPVSVTEIPDGAFAGTSLKDIYYEGTKKQWDNITIGNYNDKINEATIHYLTSDTPEENKILDYIDYEIVEDKNGNKTVTITSCDTSISGSHIIPELIEGYPVTSIGHSAFEDCTSLTSITIPDSVTSIGDDAFSNCEGLTFVKLPSTEFYLKRAHVSTFKDCINLNEVVNLENLLVKSNNGTFGTFFNTKLTKVKFPEGIVQIEHCMFMNCYSLKEIHIPRSLKTMAPDSFGNCNNLTDIYYNGTEDEFSRIIAWVSDTDGEYITMSANDYFSGKTIHYNQAISTEEFVLNNSSGSSIWQPNTDYKAGDIVIANLWDWDYLRYYTYCIECTHNHTSTDIADYPNMVEPDFDNKWTVLSICQVKTAWEAHTDTLGREFVTTYTTKDELSDEIDSFNNTINSLDSKINSLGSTALKRVIETYLPSDYSIDLNTIYMIKVSEDEDENVYNEYIGVPYYEIITDYTLEYVFLRNPNGEYIMYFNEEQELTSLDQPRITSCKLDDSTLDKWYLSIDASNTDADYDSYVLVIDISDHNNILCETLNRLSSEQLENLYDVIISFDSFTNTATLSLGIPHRKLELIGSTKVNLEGYATKDELNNQIGNINQILDSIV